MDEVVKRQKLDLRNALLQFCFEERIEDVQLYEQHFTSQELEEFGYPNLGGTSNRGKERRFGSGRADFRRQLDAAWIGILLDFRQRVERGKIVVAGCLTRPQRVTEQTIIPSQWATDFKIDALRNTIEIGVKLRYVAIEVGEPECFADDAASDLLPVIGDAMSSRPAEVTAENVRLLTDEQVIWLLEDYARRVVEHPGAKIFPGKISHMPIILRMMRHRAEHGETLPKVAQEARALEAWIKTKLPSHQVLTAGTIENNIRVQYNEQKPRSTGMKP